MFTRSDLFRPTYLKTLCHAYGLVPSKQYGQHYLTTAAPINQMIAAAALSKDDTVIEIGPGFGILTFALAERVKKTIAVEIEKKLQPYWEEKMKEYPNVEMVWGNALSRLQTTDYRLRTTDDGQTRDTQDRSLSTVVCSPYKVLANLPYQITSNVLRLFLESDHKPEQMVLMVQKEVAERICAKPGDMSLLAVSVQYYGAPTVIAQVPRGNFWPEPRVDSTVIVIKTFKHLNIQTLADRKFFRVVKAGFAHKRKQLWRNLASGLGLDGALVKQVLREIVGDEKVRAEELAVEEWRRLAQAVSAV